MKKAGLVERVAQQAKIRKAAAQRAIEALVDAVNDALRTDGKVIIAGLGVLKLKTTKERKARNPKTGEQVIVPPRKKVVFKPNSALKAMIKSL